MTATIVHDTTEAVCLSAEHNLYLKPIAKMTISVALPQLKLPGKSISNWEVMERVKAMVAPEQFSALRISKSTLDYIRFEGEVENKTVVKSLLTRLDGKTIKLSGFTDVLKVRAVENKVDFPTRHDWDSFFRDAKDMNETLPGERPDTIHLEGLPCRWFSQRNSQFPDRPSEAVLTAVFQAFGKVRHVDIPMLDPYREEMLDKNFSTFSFGGHLNFEAYVQYQEYCGFTKAMDSLRGMKLMLKGDDGKAVACNIKVIFDTSKHLSDVSIKRRNQERLKLQELERGMAEIKEEVHQEHKIIYSASEVLSKSFIMKSSLIVLREKEERRNLKKVKRQQEQEQKKLQVKIAMEERRLLLAQRNLESIRLIAELLARAKILKQQQQEKEMAERKEQEKLEQARQKEELARLQQLEACRRRQEQELRRVEVEKQRALELQRKENELRERLLCNLIKKSTAAADPHDLAGPPAEAAAPDLSDVMLGVLGRVNGVKTDEGKEKQVSSARSGERGRERSSQSQGGRRHPQSPSRKRRSSSRRRRSHRTSEGRHRGRRRSSSRSSSRGRSLSSSGRSHSRGRSQGRSHRRYGRRRSKDYRSHSRHSRRYRRHSDSRGRSHSRGH
uniref:A kinase (PRKA) anchor protein 17A n=1 Tax=Poecilia formosa TaxID=48698 RepID=A0A087XEN6_POEFO